MKATTLSLLVLQTTGVLAAAVSKLADAADAVDCGDLGVMDWSHVDLPGGIDRNDLRKCKEHPLALTSRQVNEGVQLLQKRECWYEKKIGCSSGGWCFKNCATYNPGAWCWLARNKGFGNWVGCVNDADCILVESTGWSACGQGDCEACGCNCKHI